MNNHLKWFAKLIFDLFFENEYETKVQSICFRFCWSFLVFFLFNLGVDFLVPFCFRKKSPPVHYSSVGNSVTQHAKYNYWPVWGWMLCSQNFNNKLSPAACTCYPCFLPQSCGFKVSLLILLVRCVRQAPVTVQRPQRERHGLHFVDTVRKAR